MGTDSGGFRDHRGDDPDTDSDPDSDFRAAAARKSLVGSVSWRLNPFSVLPAVVADLKGRGTVDDNGDENGGRDEGGVEALWAVKSGDDEEGD